MQRGAVHCHNWDSLINQHPGDIAACAAQAAELQRSDLACLIYTSGTGGAPRGVMQHHGAILHNIDGCIDIIAGDFGWGDDVFLSFLPLSHAYEHSGGQFFPIRSEEHTSELQSLMRISYAVFCLKKNKKPQDTHITH